MTNARRVMLAMMAACAPVASLAAQVTVSADAAVNSQYQWRGITTTNRPVVQPNLAIAFPAGRFSVTASSFTSFEAGRYDDAAQHISENGGAHAGLAEYDFALEASVPVGRATLAFGGSTYGYPNAQGTTSASNTVEAYVRAEFDAPFAPSIAFWQDVQKVQGSYAEVGFSRDIGTISFGAVSGWNFGQSVGDGGTLGYFARKGFTHADISASTSWTMGAISASPSLHVILGSDPSTTVSSPSKHSNSKVWLGTTLSWSREYGKRANNNANANAAAPSSGK